MLHTIKTTTKKKKTKLVGRGGKRGKTSGRGTKGQKARAGHKIRPHIRDIIKKLPKLRGRGKNSNKAFRATAFPINLELLNANFAPNDRVSPGTLFAKGLVVRANGKFPAIKILGTGTLDKPLRIYDCIVSASAEKAITAVGGTIGGQNQKHEQRA